jgi:osmotically-inducible protein OsmY
MNITQKSSIVILLLVAAGCSHQERQARYDENTSSPRYGAFPSTSGGSATAIPSTVGQLSEADRNLIGNVQHEMNKDSSLVPLTSSIQITAQDGTVTLSGNVPSEQDKQRAEAAAKSASNVVSVNNQLQVSGQPVLPSDQSSVTPSSTGQSQPLSPTSQQTSARIYTEAQKDSSLSPTGVTEPDSFSQNIQGLSESDRPLAQQIGQELNAEPSTAGLVSNLKIEVSDGKATLRGNVNSEDEKTQVESAIKKVSGVTSVDNQLQVGAASQSETTPKQD